MIWDSGEKKCTVVEICPADFNIKLQNSEEENTYLQLLYHDYKIRVIPLTIEGVEHVVHCLNRLKDKASLNQREENSFEDFRSNLLLEE